MRNNQSPFVGYVGATELGACLRAFPEVPRLRSGVRALPRGTGVRPLLRSAGAPRPAWPNEAPCGGKAQPGCWIGIHLGRVQPRLLWKGPAAWRSYCSLVIELIAVPTVTPDKAAVGSWPLACPHDPFSKRELKSVLKRI